MLVCGFILLFFFFFSSRRRHTRSKRDWSSDVCSSDLKSIFKQLWLKAGEKMLFANGTKGIALDTERLCLKVVPGDDPAVLVHDPKNRSIAHMLVELPNEGFPVALGVLYEDPAPTFEQAVIEQNAAAA